jgi:hypothetical protein
VSRENWDDFSRTMWASSGTFYIVLAFQAGLNENRNLLAVNCLAASVYLFFAGKAHSRVTKRRKRDQGR